MDQRYLYTNSAGELQGPFWLSQMRELFDVGKIHKRTEVCLDGENAWGPLTSFPEITLGRQEMERTILSNETAERKAYEQRLWVWLGLLSCLYALYAVISFR